MRKTILSEDGQSSGASTGGGIEGHIPPSGDQILMIFRQNTVVPYFFFCFIPCDFESY